jgi:hypothetical protein
MADHRKAKHADAPASTSHTESVSLSSRFMKLLILLI